MSKWLYPRDIFPRKNPQVLAKSVIKTAKILSRFLCEWLLSAKVGIFTFFGLVFGDPCLPRLFDFLTALLLNVARADVIGFEPLNTPWKPFTIYFCNLKRTANSEGSLKRQMKELLFNCLLFLIVYIIFRISFPPRSLKRKGCFDFDVI